MKYRIFILLLGLLFAVPVLAVDDSPPQADQIEVTVDATDLTAVDFPFVGSFDVLDTEQPSNGFRVQTDQVSELPAVARQYENDEARLDKYRRFVQSNDTIISSFQESQHIKGVEIVQLE